MVNWRNAKAVAPDHISGPIRGLYRFICSCSRIMGVDLFDRPPEDVRGETWPHVHKASWAVPVRDGLDDLKRPVIMAIKPECRGPDAYRAGGRWWDRRGF